MQGERQETLSLKYRWGNLYTVHASSRHNVLYFTV